MDLHHLILGNGYPNYKVSIYENFCMPLTMERIKQPILSTSIFDPTLVSLSNSKYLNLCKSSTLVGSTNLKQ